MVDSHCYIFKRPGTLKLPFFKPRISGGEEGFLCKSKPASWARVALTLRRHDLIEGLSTMIRGEDFFRYPDPFHRSTVMLLNVHNGFPWNVQVAWSRKLREKPGWKGSLPGRCWWVL